MSLSFFERETCLSCGDLFRFITVVHPRLSSDISGKFFVSDKESRFFSRWPRDGATESFESVIRTRNAPLAVITDYRILFKGPAMILLNNQGCFPLAISIYQKIKLRSRFPKFLPIPFFLRFFF